MKEIKEVMKKTWEMLKAKGLFNAWNSYEEWLARNKKDENTKYNLPDKDFQNSQPKRDRTLPPSSSLF